MRNDVISHLRQSADGSWQIQTNKEHSDGVAALASKFCSLFGMEEWGRVLGLLHDRGKERPEFQSYIREVSGFGKGECAYNAITKRHAYVGAILAKAACPKAYPLLSIPIEGHHSGLHDHDDFVLAMKQELPDGIDRQTPTASLALDRDLLKSPDEYNHLIRMLFSCLVDADFLDTESFMTPGSAGQRGGGDDMATLSEKLRRKMDEMCANAPKTPVNSFRAKILSACMAEADAPQGFFSLTVPTGGGKTLASMVWALRHAVRHGLRRVIVVIPYTSIITQTAQVLRDVFGDKNVLEHHSATDDDSDDCQENPLKLRSRLATENWDAPIVVTTNVQFFESLFSNKPSKCRKLHNIARSVVLMDEVQTLPVDFLNPIVSALKAYQRLFGVSFLFMTASQPILGGESLDALKRECREVNLSGIGDIKEISPDADGKSLPRRTNINFCYSTPWSYDDLAERLMCHDRVLCVVNTRQDALEVYRRMDADNASLTFHLSRMMCGEHIRRTIGEIRKALKEDPLRKVRVISTQLIEAGVDLDFPAVFRQVAGLDSILQAAGRCNREGLLGHEGEVTVFSLPRPQRGSQAMAEAAFKSMRAELGEGADVMTQRAMTAYFAQYYALDREFDKKGIGADLNSKEVQFASAAEKFKLIEDGGQDVIVPFGRGAELLDQLRREGESYSLMRKLRPYAVSVRRRVAEDLLAGGIVGMVAEGVLALTSAKQYDDKVGLLAENVSLNEIMMI